MSAHPLPFISPEEYLAVDRSAEIRSEYFQGRIYAMSGGTAAHAVIATNWIGELRAALRGTLAE